MKNEKEFDWKLHDICMAMMELEDARIEEEMKNAEPHVFSEEFERKMDALIHSMNSKKSCSKVRADRKEGTEEEEGDPRPRYLKKMKYLIAAIVAACFVSVFLFLDSKNIVASQNSLRIKVWMEDFFVVEEKFEKKEGVLFEESRIGYMPEGFEKVKEGVSYSRVYYKFQNGVGEYINIEVNRSKIESMIDIEDSKQDVFLNKAGLSYHYVFKTDTQESVVTWKDEKGIYYQLLGNCNREEIVKVMDSISY